MQKSTSLNSIKWRRRAWIIFFGFGLLGLLGCSDGNRSADRTPKPASTPKNVRLEAIEEEIRAANEKIKQDPKLANAYVDRGQAQARKGNLPDALEDLNEAIRLDSKLARAYA